MRRAILVLLLALVVLRHAGAAEFFETGDAGQTLDFAEDVEILGPVEAIHGRIEHSLDSDLFRLVIDEPAAFSATAIRAGTSAPDLQLFLFDEHGHGIVASDNVQFSPLPAIPSGTLQGQRPGLYLLAVSPADDDPLGALGEIFPDAASGISRPEGLSRFDPLLGWTLDYTAAGGDYAIALVASSGTLELLPGDYNYDGTVNLADYTAWRDMLGATGVALAADGHADGVIDAFDFAVWKTNFGMSAPAAIDAAKDAAIPEPATVVLLACVAVAESRLIRRRTQHGWLATGEPHVRRRPSAN